MPARLKPLIVIVLLLAAGVPRLWFETGLHRELHDAKLLIRPLSVSAREKIDQTSWAVALGGLRTLVATFLNLRAHALFEQTRWEELAGAYDTLVDFAPQTRDYWLTGAWHQSNNASSYYAYDSDLPPLRRKAEWRAAIQRGREFLQRGLRNNPDDWRLHAEMGNQLSDVQRLPDFAAAADAYQAALDSGRALPFIRRALFRALARVPGRETEALQLGRELYADRANRSPMLVAVLFALESQTQPPAPADERAIALFGNAKAAYAGLKPLWQRTRDRYPTDGVADALTGLERRLGVLPGDSIFRQSLQHAPEAVDPFAR